MAETLLIEIGTEELPPPSLARLARVLGETLVAGLGEAAVVQHPEWNWYASPRRLAVRVEAVAERAPDRQLERRGPALQAAFDADGRPTQAALGFARSVGLEVDQLETLETPKGRWLLARQQQIGQLTADLLPDLLERALKALPIERRMRWGEGHHGEFVRPVHWVLALHGDAVLPLHLFGIEAGRSTRGHRFHSPEPVALKHADHYVDTLERHWVLADFAQRRARVAEQVQQAFGARGAHAVLDEELLDEVTSLVEWPVPVLGGFDEDFLEVPAEVLVASMRDHQKYFHALDAEGRLLPLFVTLANIDSAEPERIRTGNERVLRARLADARYFWDTDRQTPLHDRAAQLADVVFQKQLGSVADKVERVAALAQALAAALGLDAAEVARAARLCKADLLSEMVGEFPELQGVMGAYYARAEGEPESVVTAIREHYLPRFAGDQLPQTPLGQVLALAERLDTLCGIFAVVGAPSGDRDPYALRRAALGVARLLIETPLPVDLPEWIGRAAGALQRDDAGAVSQAVTDFIYERLRGYFEAQGQDSDVVESVLVLRPGRLDRVALRIAAVADLRSRPEAESLTAANKRIGNMLARETVDAGATVRADLVESGAEQALLDGLEAARAAVLPAVERGDYQLACTRLASLREVVDEFFENVLVMADDEAVRRNRLTLLAQLHTLFLEVADLSVLQPGGGR